MMIPAKMVALFLATACPTGWTSVQPLFTAYPPLHGMVDQRGLGSVTLDPTPQMEMPVTGLWCRKN